MRSLIFVIVATLTSLPCVAQGQPARSVTLHRVGMRAWMGVGVGDLTPDRAKALKLEGTSGVEVFQVEEGSPAANAGVRSGDVILDIDSQKIQDGEHFVRIIAESTPGSKLEITIWRSGSKHHLSATLEARPIALAIPAPIIAFGPESFPVMPVQSPRAGFDGESLTPQLAEYFGVRDGVLVRSVLPKSAAEKAGLKAGDVVIKVDGTPVSSPREISGLLRGGRGAAAFTVVRNHKQMVLTVETAAIEPLPLPPFADFSPFPPR